MALLCAAAGPPGGGPPGGPPGTGGPPDGSPKSPSEQKDESPEPAVPMPWPKLYDPLGFAGESPIHEAPAVRRSRDRASVPVPDRWRIGWPSWDRYGRRDPADEVLMSAFGGDIPYTEGHPLNPYDKNVLKGDYPILGDDVFAEITAIADTRYNHRRLPTPSGVSAARAGSFDFFGDGEQSFFEQRLIGSLELFQGYGAFRPVGWRFVATGAYSHNDLELEERNNVAVDVREGAHRTDSHAAVDELFFEYHLGDLSPRFDFAALRAGRQLFVSDFRGFIYNDIADGLRLLGNLDNNRIEYNLALFNQTEVDTNSGLPELDWRDQQVLIGNVFFRDFIWDGYTTQLSYHWNHDQSDRHFDENGFLVRPDLAGSVTLHDVDAHYLGWAGSGHIGRVNVEHALYYALGRDDANPIAGRAVDIRALLAALELSYDLDWLRPKVSLLYASGDEDPLDDTAGGFDGIQDNPVFAGGPKSLYQSQALRLFGVNLVSANSFYNDLAASKKEGQANFVNPGTIVAGAGIDAEITQKLRATLEANSIWIDEPATLELFLNQDDIDRHLGEEINLSAQYRPFLNNNVILSAGGSVFFPGEGFEDLFADDDRLHQVFASLTVEY